MKLCLFWRKTTAVYKAAENMRAVGITAMYLMPSWTERKDSFIIWIHKIYISLELFPEISKMKSKKDKKVVGIPDNHFPGLLSNLSSLQSREKFTDVVFLCRGGEQGLADRWFLFFSKNYHSQDVSVLTEPCWPPSHRCWTRCSTSPPRSRQQTRSSYRSLR